MSTYGELNWFKSSYSRSQGDDCVEVALASEAVHGRDTRTQEGPRFAVSADAWGGFLRYVRR